MEFLNNQIFLLVISVLLGAFVGLRREVELQKKNVTGFRGLRTNALVSLFGTVSTFFSSLPYLPAIFFSFLGIYMAIIYWNGVKKGKIGLTSETSLLLMFWSGVLIGYGKFLVGIILGLMIAVSDAYKDKMHDFAKTLSLKEWSGALQMILISFVLLYFLPNKAIDPWGILNPREIWILVVIITALGFVGYFINKYFKSDKIKGVYLTSFLGALISSTAVTVEISAKIREQKIDLNAFKGSLFLAILVMQIRDLVLIFVSSPIRKIELFYPSIVMIFASLVAFVYYFWKDGKNKNSNLNLKMNDNDSPFDIIPALKFAFIFSLILILVYFIKKYFGDTAVYLMTFVVGLVDTESLILPSLESMRNGTLDMETVKNMILIVLIVNTFVKWFYILFIGGKKASREVLFPLILVSFSALIVLVF